MKKSKKRMFIVILFSIVVAIGLMVMFKGAYLEKLEIGEQYVSVFWTNFRYKIISLVVTFAFIFMAFYSTNKRILSGLKEFFEEEKKEIPRLPNKSISLVIATLVSLVTSNLTMNKLILFINNTSFEREDPIFHHDIGYYMFQKPFLEYLLWFGIGTIIAITVYAGIYYIVTLNTQFDGVKSETLKNSRIVKQLLSNAKVLSVLIAILTFFKTQDISSSKFLSVGEKNVYSLYGAGLADISIKLWGYRILSIIIVVSVFYAISAYNKGKTKKVIGSILTVPIYLCLLVITLVSYDAMFINSNELDKQKKYINYNIESTRNSYNIEIDEISVENDGALEEKDIANNVKLLSNISITNRDLVLQNLNGALTNKGYYKYSSSQIGQYEINNEDALVYISPREIVNKENSYINSTYEYTHGYGVIVTSATSINSDGSLVNYQKGFNDKDIKISQPRIYFGMQTNDTIVTNSNTEQELDYLNTDGTNETNSYDGKAGLKLGFINRVILALSQGDTKLVFSSKVKSDSKILINRNIIKRAKTIMPYLTYDEHPYLVATNEGKLVWVIDAYTTSNYYPYAQKTSIDGKELNYIRNSVKVLVDAYDGTTTFYIVDRTDPIIMAYRKAYPKLFADLEAEIPEGIEEHFVYPEYLYNIQANILKRYHNIQADVLYRTDDVWDTSTYSLAGSGQNSVAQIPSYYTMAKLIDEDKDTLSLLLPYTISGKQNITAYLVGTYINGKPSLKLYDFPDDNNVLGLLQLDTQIEQNEEIYKQISSLNVSGTKLTKNITVVPIDNKLLYVEAFYQQYINEEDALPTLKKVVVASGNKVAIGDNLKSALANLVSQNAIGIEIQSTDDVDGLIELIIKANKNLEESTASGDWEMVGKDMEKLQSLITKLEKVYEEEQNKKQEETKDIDFENKKNNKDIKPETEVEDSNQTEIIKNLKEQNSSKSL